MASSSENSIAPSPRDIITILRAGDGKLIVLRSKLTTNDCYEWLKDVGGQVPPYISFEACEIITAYHALDLDDRSSTDPLVILQRMLESQGSPLVEDVAVSASSGATSEHSATIASAAALWEKPSASDPLLQIRGEQGKDKAYTLVSSKEDIANVHNALATSAAMTSDTRAQNQLPATAVFMGYPKVRTLNIADIFRNTAN
ncbi:hypothetical protein SCHPADRAFT_947290 [Schizopora paradoxa]|uniref:Uncharacterized protein n=1 Tax=Schizopora paradoxa TaxID=27342 RepID=A0A0H2R125_9AGAM|nr:hypothetical protein SCHPADRAFT_947290 [Schizopora paradoxa]